jgi:hypothetical protein
VREATGGTIDLLVATHEHHDHLCGFEYAKEEWLQIEVHNIWVAWTENADHPATASFDHEQEALEQLAQKAAKVVARQLAENPTLALDPERRALASNLRRHALAPELKRLTALLEFSEVPLEEALEFGASGPLEGRLDKISKLPNKVLADIVNHPEQRFKIPATHTRSYCEPMDVRVVPGTAVDAYVLGPPTDPNLLGLAIDEGEVYPEEAEKKPVPEEAASHVRERIALAIETARADRLAFNGAIERHTGAPDKDEYAPFRRSEGISWDRAMKDDFFGARYFGVEPERRIDGEWLHDASRFALQLDELTNNTSLALAFRVPNDRYLLFVGDAQVGNWLSWHQFKLDGWKRADGQGGELAAQPTIGELLGKTAVYKVGHHGSHNATLKQNGLEKMPNDLVAFVPVAHSYPQRDKEWSIPLPSLMRRLKEKTGGQVVVPYDNEYTSAGFQANRIETSVKDLDLPAMTREDKEPYGGPVPLWKQVRIAS